MNDSALSHRADFLEESIDGPRISGRLYAEEGMALIQYQETCYFIEPEGRTFGEEVHALTLDEMSMFHMRNLHHSSRIELSVAEIGDPPFSLLMEKLKGEHAISQCTSLIDILLDPWGDLSDKTRALAAVEMEDLLIEFPELYAAVAEKMSTFIPPEDYVLDTAAIFSHYDECFEEPAEEGDPQTFEEAFPLLFKAMSEAQNKWEENLKIPNIQRVTRAAIQHKNNSKAECAASNILERYTKTRITLLQCVLDIETSVSAATNTWKNGWRHRDLDDAKRNTSSAKVSRLINDRQRFVEADSEFPETLARFDRALLLMQESTVLLAEVEGALGEI